MAKMTLSGFLNLYKPQGLTSHQCVNIIRKMFKLRQVGHGGTLDPMATGVLLIAVGKATRFLQYVSKEKEYDATIRYGITTKTDDITGIVVKQNNANWLQRAEVEETLKWFIGKIDQVPPLISAIKKDGKRLYQLARSKQCDSLMINPREVEIYDIQLVEFIKGLNPEAKIKVHCGSGTYIRSIARESGETIKVPRGKNFGCSDICVGGTLSALSRIRNGIFHIQASLTFDEIDDKLQAGLDPLEPIESALCHLPKIEMTEDDELRWRKGGTVRASAGLKPNGDVYNPQHGDFVRIYRASDQPQFLGISHVYCSGEGIRAAWLRKRLFI